MRNVAEKVRLEKEVHPERFCAVKKCLWRIVTSRGQNPCRNHPLPGASFDLTANAAERKEQHAAMWPRPTVLPYSVTQAEARAAEEGR